MMVDDANSRIVNAQGVVKWFDPKKGYGFIVGPDGQDIFVHYSKINGDGFRVLKDGAAVAYDAELTDRGWHASRVVRGESLEVSLPARRNYTRSPRR